jgi:hypothetical protein
MVFVRSAVDVIGFRDPGTNDLDPPPDWGVKNGVENDMPVPGMPNVAREPLPEKLRVAEHGRGAHEFVGSDK